MAKSRHALPAQIIFLASHLVGLVMGVTYNARTPDLYPNNAHHKIGWIATVVVILHVCLSMAQRVIGSWAKSSTGRFNQDFGAYIPVTQSALDTHQRLSIPPYHHSSRSSYDSGHGTDRETESLRSNFVLTAVERPASDHSDSAMNLSETSPLDQDRLNDNGWYRYASTLISRCYARRNTALNVWYSFVDWIILPYGFVSICTGIVAFGRLFVSFHIHATPFMSSRLHTSCSRSWQSACQPFGQRFMLFRPHWGGERHDMFVY